MYDAIDIAEYVLNYCEKVLNRPITNLQLQKFLYYIQGEYLCEHREPIFDNEIEAWAYGPVVPDVYYAYNSHMSKQIKGVEFVDIIDAADKELINKVVGELISIQPWKLVEKTHKEDPWNDNYRECKNIEIPIEEIEEYFLKIRG